MRQYEIRLQLIAAKAQLLMEEHKRCNGRPWHQDVKASLGEILSEAQKAYNEVAEDRSWESADR